jgi:hypothetical protein
VPLVPCSNHCVAKVPFGLGASQEPFSNDAQCCGVAEVLGLGLLEAGGEFVSVVDDLLGGARHGVSPEVLRSGRHGVDDDGTVGAVDDADLEELASGIGADEHHEAFVEVLDEGLDG